MMGWLSAVIERRRNEALVAILLLSVVLAVSAVLAGTAIGTTTDCNNPATLNGSAFEIDTDANQTVGPGCIDWLDTSTKSGLQRDAVIKPDTQSGSGDESFGNGTKEDTAEPSVVDGSIPPNKSDLKAFGVFTEAGEVTAGNPTGKSLELLWTRVQDPSGTTNMDFELNQKSCGPAPTFTNCASNHITPLRTSGDKLITYDLSRGGTQATISIRTWNGSVWGSPTVLTDQNPVLALGTINTSPITAGNSLSSLGALSPRTFGEASISFSALFGNNTCGQFGSAYLKSRASDSFTAALKDFVPPTQVSISNCSALTTDATDSVTIGSPISDTATLSGVTSNAGGTITFKAYSDSNCSNLAFTSSAVPVTGPGTYNSGPFTPTAVGTYYWIASYSGDASNTPISGSCRDANESSVVNKANPEIATNATASVTIGSPIKDTATLSGGFNPTGTITFSLFSDDQCTDEVDTNLQPATVNGNGDYSSGNYTPTAAGTYYWIASYSGDANNAPVSGSCRDANESSVVSSAEPDLVTSATASVTIGSSISDTATLSGGQSPTGTITFKLYSDDQCQNEVNTSLQPKTVNGNGNYSSGNYTPTAVGTYYWIASYSGDANNAPVSGSCGDANESSTVNKAPSSISTAQAIFPQDSGTVSASAGGTPTGSITFELYGPDDATCSGNPVYEETVSLSNGKASTSNSTFSVKSANASDYKWLVSYSGDDKHDGTTSACGTEHFTLTIDNG